MNLTSQDRYWPDRSRFDVRERQEPLVDVISTEGEIRIIALLPSVEKEDVRLHGTEYTLSISVDTPQRRYHKDVDLPARVDPQRAVTSFRNSVLEVVLPKK